LCQEPTVTKSFAAIICFAVTLLAATGAQGCSNPGDALRADPVLTKTETTAQQSGPKDPSTTEQGAK
jgi:hypothetical protein